MQDNNEVNLPNNIETAIKLAAAIGSPKLSFMPGDPSSSIPYTVVPEGYKLEDLETLFQRPFRKVANVFVTTTDSFINYTKKHGSLAECVIYADINAEQPKCILEAMINDHAADEPGWRDHKCKFSPELSVEWRRWLSKNKIQMSQADFATWIEDNLSDIASMPGMPTGAEMLKLALAFEATADKRLKSHVNLQSGGVRFEYIEDEDKDTRTSMEVFQRFTLGLPVFEGASDAYPVEARLKYRNKEGKVTFWYELIRPDRAFKTAVQSALDIIKAATGFMILYGTP